ncbi:MAG: IS1380 family transposase [Blastocatellia bacterium]|nr:IS1380 family transposase [Blastocatellia bacterium]
MNEKKHREKKPARQPFQDSDLNSNKIRASTPYQFNGKNLTAYGGLLPVATMLERLGFEELVENTITCSRETRVMSLYKFVLGIVLGLYIGFPRLNQLRFIARDPMLTGILSEPRLPPQSTLWRFLASLHLNVAAQILKIQCAMRQRVWQAANIQLKTVTLDTDTTVHTLYGNQMGGRKSYNPKNKGKKSYQPMLTFIAETREYLWGELRNGDRPTGKQVYEHLNKAIAALPEGVGDVSARADSGFYCAEAVQAYEEANCGFVIVARKTSRLVQQLEQADWRPSPKTDADEQCEFVYQPEGWTKAHRFIALRYAKDDENEPQDEVQYQLFETRPYKYRVFVTNLKDSIPLVVWFYNQRAGAENLIKEANNDAGLAAHPSGRFDVNRNHFQLAMLAYNLNAWLMLFNREPQSDVNALKHTTLATSRLRFLFIAAKIWRHAGRTGVSYSDHYEERTVFQRLMSRLRNIVERPPGFKPVIVAPLC